MNDDRASRTPPLALSTVAVIALMIVWAYVRLFLFKTHVVPLTFVLPMMICIWTRRAWHLGLMSVAFIGIAVLKTFYMLPSDLMTPGEDWGLFATTVFNVGMGAFIIYCVMSYRDRVDAHADRIAQQHAELEAQAEELAQQNEEIRAQSEELAQQNEEVESQSEELERQNAELQESNARLISRESVLQAIAASARSTDGGWDVLAEVCRRTLDVIGGSAEAVAVLQREDNALRLVSHARLEVQPPLRETWPLEQSLANVVLQEDRTAYVDDLRERPDLAAPFFDEGSVRSLLVTPVYVKGQQCGVLAVCGRDVTHWTREQFRLVEWVAAQCGLILEGIRAQDSLRDRTTQLEAANRSKDRFMAMLSHELRTPLTPVLAAASSLESDPRLPEDIHDDIAMIRRNVAVQSRLVDDLLDLTRVSTGKLHLHKQVLPVHTLLHEAAGIVAGDLDARGMTLSLQVDLPHDACVEGDNARLQQVVWNLLKNAIKFSAPGSRIQLTARRHASDPGRVQISVTDHGIGIAPEDLERIFQPFEQGAQNEDGASRQGLGLGLCIARAIVDQHGGRVSAASAGVGQGSVFTVDLPLVRCGDETADETERTAIAEIASAKLAASISGVRILLVEDHADTAKVVVRLLKSQGYVVTHCPDIAQALQSAQTHPYDLLISDLGLPDGSGLDLMRQIRQRHPQLTGICLSGYGMDSDVAASQDAGFAEHLTKPVELTQLQAAIGRVLATQRAEV